MGDCMHSLDIIGDGSGEDKEVDAMSIGHSVSAVLLAATTRLPGASVGWLEAKM